MTRPIIVSDLSLYFGERICFEDFSAQIPAGERIAVIGDNGSGKTCLLKIIAGQMQPSDGTVETDASIALVPQIVQDYDNLSGGERFNKALTAALAQNPDVLLLDEPTNHLDRRNRTSLMNMLKYFTGTLIVVSHDAELLRRCVDKLWHIDGGKINIFSGKYDDYRAQAQLARGVVEAELDALGKEKKAAHKSLMREQNRAAQSRKHGEKQAAQARWAPIVAGGKKRQAQNTAASKNADLNQRREDISGRMASLYMPEIIKPKFSITPSDIGAGGVVVVHEGSVAYGADAPLLEHINITVAGGERVALEGDNGSGKTTIIKAMLGAGEVTRGGDWTLPKISDIGYLDQHYANINYSDTVLGNITPLMPGAKHEEVRDFLNDFLFRKQGEVNALASNLSGGERARLSLAMIAARTPKLLILDEITNNIDLTTKEHITQILREYPGALIVISHERDFLEEIGINKFYDVAKFKSIKIGT